MKKFQYKAINANGKTITSSCEADARGEALSLLKSWNLRPLSLCESEHSAGRNPRIGKKTITRFYAMLGSQLEVGVPLLSALTLIQQQEQHDDVKRVFGSICQRVESGSSLSDALSRWPETFPEVDLNLIRAGEEGGFLSDSLSHITQMREWQQKLTAGVWAASAYPLLLVSVAALLVPGVLVFLVPKLEPIFHSLRQGEQLPWATTVLLNVSYLCKEYGVWLLAVGLGSFMVCYWLSPRSYWVSVRDRLLLQMPGVGKIVRDLVLARFFRVMGTLLQNRIQVTTSLEIATKVIGNRCLASSFSLAQEEVASGKLLATAFENAQQIPADALAMISVAEQSNTLDHVLVKIATQLEFRTNQRLETAVKLVEPVLLLVMALFVGFVVLALLLPIFEGQSLG